LPGPVLFHVCAPTPTSTLYSAYIDPLAFVTLPLTPTYFVSSQFHIPPSHRCSQVSQSHDFSFPHYSFSDTSFSFYQIIFDLPCLLLLTCYLVIQVSTRARRPIGSELLVLHNSHTICHLEPSSSHQPSSHIIDCSTLTAHMVFTRVCQTRTRWCILLRRGCQVRLSGAVVCCQVRLSIFRRGQGPVCISSHRPQS
jgi:hypothetical protein